MSNSNRLASKLNISDLREIRFEATIAKGHQVQMVKIPKVDLPYSFFPHGFGESAAIILINSTTIKIKAYNKLKIDRKISWVLYEVKPESRWKIDKLKRAKK